MKYLNFCLSILTVFACYQTSFTQIKMPTIFGDQMVLQQKSTIYIWGWAKVGTEVTAKGSWPQAKGKTVTDSTGRWMLQMLTTAAGGPYTLEIKGEYKIKKHPKQDTLITYQDVYLGEVWVCSGQSNMQWPLKQADRAEEEIKAADYPKIRLFSVKRQYSQEPLPDTEGEWVLCSPETVAGFSAVGYFFGRELHQKMKVPVGLIHTSWGGTPVEAWMSERGLQRVIEYEEEFTKINLMRAKSDSIGAQYKIEMDRWNQAVLAKMGKHSRGQIEMEGDWQQMQLPQLWEKGGLKDFDGSVWFKKIVEIPEAWSGKDLTLSLGPIDDMDVSWFNDMRVGGYEEQGHYNTARIYTIPATAVKAGSNLIMVKAMDTGGGGGFGGQAKDMYINVKDDPSTLSISLAGNWAYKIEVELTDMPPRPSMPHTIGPRAPMNLFNGMVAPLMPYGINGVIWYQGESNTNNPELYKSLFPGMIRDWRSRWNIGDFSFFFVQIAPYKYGTPLVGAKLREAQLEGLDMRNTGMVVTMDIGDPEDIHPTNKQEVGHRLALLAQNKTFGYQDVVSSGPMYNFMKIEGDKIRLYFQHTHGGLMAKGDELTHFEMAGKDKKFYPAKAVIQGESILVSSEQVAEPKAVRYGFTNTAVPNLYNGAGLPASSFRTDKW